MEWLRTRRARDIGTVVAVRRSRWSVARAIAACAIALAATSCGQYTVASTAAAAAPPSASGVSVPRAADCPSATVKVSTANGLQTALGQAKPGTVIRLAPGRYVGEFEVHASGSRSAPIWLCGPRTAVLTTGSYTMGHALTVADVSEFSAAGFSIDNAFKGVTVLRATRVSISDLSITNIGYEAVHLRANTVESVVAYNTISNTGLIVRKYGEGIYLGTSNAQWCRLYDCRADHTDRIVVRGNTIFNTGAQPIEAKEGTSGGYIEDNVVIGTSRIENHSKSLILVKGNDYIVTGNSVTRPPKYGLQTIASSDGWGRDNSFAGNRVVNAPEEAIWIHRPGGGSGALGNKVYCSNVTDNSRLTNIGCID